MSCLSSCLINDGIQKGNITSIKEKVAQNAEDLIHHHHLLNTYINKMINKGETQRIYQIFTVEGEYNYITSNWEEKIKKSILIDEIYSIHYYLKIFDVESGRDNRCRLKDYFFNMNYKTVDTTQIYDVTTNEEKFIYYIGQNIITNFTDDLEKLSKITNEILNQDNKTQN